MLKSLQLEQCTAALFVSYEHNCLLVLFLQINIMVLLSSVFKASGGVRLQCLLEECHLCCAAAALALTTLCHSPLASA